LGGGALELMPLRYKFLFLILIFFVLPVGSGAHDLVLQVFDFSFEFFIIITRAAGLWSS
jgi:hypothetical protein